MQLTMEIKDIIRQYSPINTNQKVDMVLKRVFSLLNAISKEDELILSRNIIGIKVKSYYQGVFNKLVKKTKARDSSIQPSGQQESVKTTETSIAKENKTVAKKNAKKSKKEKNPGPLDSFRHVSSTSEIDSLIGYFIEHKNQFDLIAHRWIINMIGCNESLLVYYRNLVRRHFGKMRFLEKRKEDTPKQKNVQKKVNNHSKVQTRQEPVPSVDIKVAPWVIDWCNNVVFQNGHFSIYSKQNDSVHFHMKKVYNKKSRSSFNYIREYINGKMPPIHCSIKGKELIIDDNIDFDKALLLISEISRQHQIKRSADGHQKTLSLVPLSFKQSISRAQQMSKEEFLKYKSKYIDYLVILQHIETRIVPCVENLSHSNSTIYEEAFMFSVKCHSGNTLIVVENINPDRSTLAFVVNSKQYMLALKTIHSFLQSPEINKRSGLRDGSFDFSKDGVILNESINHDDDFSSWEFNLSYLIKYQ